jgi:HNH endonuclease
MSIYRRLYEQAHGPIPKDSNGRTYDIHHIDGNRKNNHPSNLVALSIDEHYKVHYDQGDWQACDALAKRMKLSVGIISELASKANKDRVENKQHHFCSSEWQSRQAKKRVSNGTHNFIGGKLIKKLVQEGKHPAQKQENRIMQRERNLSLSKEGKHPWQNPDIARYREKKKAEEGHHNFQNPETIECPHCGKIGKGFVMRRWHLDNCKENI